MSGSCGKLSPMTTGAEQLKDWMERRGFDQRETARYFGWDETYVSKIVKGVRRPGLDNAHKIERLTGIPTQAWDSSELDNTGEPEAANSHKGQ